MPLPALRSNQCLCIDSCNTQGHSSCMPVPAACTNIVGLCTTVVFGIQLQNHK